ncbi:hypothetical protein [Natrononativus amylolyticus]|uniref:hypothetical protein n=1 Tax=Natrononativus amylolyticus TaxID=2963434 RepID=UPI0020CF588A|nr:hypothetical protein [Natrononativus amylolyticus]
MNRRTNIDDHLSYEYEIEINGHSVEFGIHYQNSICDPQICWRIDGGESAGKWAQLKIPDTASHPPLEPYITLEVADPQLVFGRLGDEYVIIGDEKRNSVPLPAELASELRDQLTHLGRVSESDSVSDDPAAFPSLIRDPDLPVYPVEWEVLGWDESTKTMWYELSNFPLASEQWAIEWEEQKAQSPRAYQIEDGDLLLRKHYWVSTSHPDESDLTVH